jgi:hypothetical protein
MRTLQVGDRPTRWAQAVAECGRIDRTLHTLNYIDNEVMHRATLSDALRLAIPADYHLDRSILETQWNAQPAVTC